jgi:dipeptidyl aminopeptidase/acylaminoacyl peptidase
MFHYSKILMLVCGVALVTQAAEQRVYRDRLQAHWLPGNTQLWYRVQTGPKAHEYVFVDAVAGQRTLTNATVAAGATNLHALAVAEAPRASKRTGPETTLHFINHTTGPVELFWLDFDGKRKSYGKIAAGKARDMSTYAGHVWLIANEAGKALAVFEAGEEPAEADIRAEAPADKPRVTAPRLKPRPPAGNGQSPDGRWQASIRDYNVWLRDVQNGVEKPLSSDGKTNDAYGGRLFWSPDSRKLVVLRTQPAEEHIVTVVESSPADQVQPKVQTFNYPKPGDRIATSKPHLFEVASGRHIAISDALFPNPWSLGDLRWAPDSSRFTFVYNQRGHQVLRVVAVDAANGAARALVDEQARTFICYSGKYFCEPLDKTGEILWMSERDGWNHLWLYDAQTGRVKNQVTRGPWVVRKVERVDAEKRQVWFRCAGIVPGQDPYYQHLARVNFDGTGLTLLTEGDGTHAVEFSPDRRFLVDAWSRVDQPPVHALRRTSDGKLVCELERADARTLLASGWKPPQRFVAKGRDGTTDIYGLIHWPDNFDVRKKHPVIEHIYAGPQDAFVPKAFRVKAGFEALRAKGFVVVQMDGMGTSNRSKKFHDVCWQNLGDSGFPDRILWLQAAAQKYPGLDLTRVGIYGGSAGGQSALRAVLAFGEVYKAAAADCGCHDNRMDKIWWNEQWMGWPVGPHYAEQSNVTQAHKLRGKLLLMVGELDHNVDPASTLQVVNALIKADKDFELIVFPGTGHGAGGSPYGQRRLVDFFVRCFHPPAP